MDLEKKKKDIAEKRTYVNYSIQELEGLISENADLFKEYSQRIREVLNQSPKQLKTALSAVNLKGPVNAVFAFTPPVRLELTT